MNRLDIDLNIGRGIIEALKVSSIVVIICIIYLVIASAWSKFDKYGYIEAYTNVFGIYTIAAGLTIGLVAFITSIIIYTLFQINIASNIINTFAVILIIYVFWIIHGLQTNSYMNSSWGVVLDGKGLTYIGYWYFLATSAECSLSVAASSLILRICRKHKKQKERNHEYFKP